MRVTVVLVFVVVLLALSQLVVTDQNSPVTTVKRTRKNGEKQSIASINAVAMAYGNASRLYSPVTLNREWPTLERLLFVVFCATLGTTINGFFVASFFVEHALRRVGNVYLACIGLSDLILTATVMPASAVVLLSSGEWDTLPVCHAMHFLTETATYSFSLFFVLISIENFLRTSRSPAEYEYFIGLGVCVQLVPVLVFIISAILAGVGVYLNLDIDYCEHNHSGNLVYRICTLVIFYGLPAFISLLCLIISIISASSRARRRKSYRRSWQYEWDSSIANLNLSVFSLFLILWTPFVIVLYMYPLSEDPKIYHFVCIGVCRSIFSSLLYSSINRHFRRAFVRLFYYCCCKSAVYESFSYRHRRGLDYNPRPGGIRVHIMHQAVNSCSPQRGTLAHGAVEL